MTEILDGNTKKVTVIWSMYYKSSYEGNESLQESKQQLSVITTTPNFRIVSGRNLISLEKDECQNFQFPPTTGVHYPHRENDRTFITSQFPGGRRRLKY